MWLVAWTLRDEDWYDDNFAVCETEDAARETYERVKAEPLLYCAAITKIVEATEPHWLSEAVR